MEKVKILHYIPGFKFGGIESRLIDWYKGIDRTKVQFDVLVHTDLDNDLLTLIKEMGGQVYITEKFSLRNYMNFIREIRKFFNSNNDYAAVHSHSLVTGYFILKRAKKHRIPKLIIHSRTKSFIGERSIFVKKILKRMTAKIANTYFACSKEAGEFLFQGIKKENFTVIKNGIQVEKFIYDSVVRDSVRASLNLKNSFVIGHVGRFTYAKNHLFLIELFKDVCERIDNAILLLVGEGPSIDEVKNLIHKYNLQDRVIFAGYKPNVNEYFQAMDVFVFPSHFEGFGTVVVEAQASGLKCLVSTGVPDSVDISGLTEHLSLSEDIRVWTEKVVDISKGYTRKNMLVEVREAGYDAKDISKFLEKQYMGIGD